MQARAAMYFRQKKMCNYNSKPWRHRVSEALHQKDATLLACPHQTFDFGHSSFVDPSSGAPGSSCDMTSRERCSFSNVSTRSSIRKWKLNQRICATNSLMIRNACCSKSLALPLHEFCVWQPHATTGNRPSKHKPAPLSE